MTDQRAIAVLIPCFNEAVAIGRVIDDFRAALPEARIYVFDNNSTDNTASVAASHGAEVRSEARQGKGNVVRRMFSDVEADLYVLVDGDGTYDAASAPALVDHLLGNNLESTGSHILGVDSWCSLLGDLSLLFLNLSLSLVLDNLLIRVVETSCCKSVCFVHFYKIKLINFLPQSL